MEDFEKQNGVAFFLIFFSQLNLFYYLPFRELLAYWRRMEEGGRKSFRKEELDEKYYLPKKSGFLVPYLGIKIAGSGVYSNTLIISNSRVFGQLCSQKHLVNVTSNIGTVHSNTSIS